MEGRQSASVVETTAQIIYRDDQKRYLQNKIEAFAKEQLAAHGLAPEQDGSHLKKAADSTCVINIVPPRSLWGKLSRLRSQHTLDARCALHCSAIDPFVSYEHYDEAGKILKAALAGFKPFNVVLDRAEVFQHGKRSFTVYLAPSKESQAALDQVHAALLQAFPQCSDLSKRGGGKVMSHVSIAKVNTKQEAEAIIKYIGTEPDMLPFTFALHELYLLHREGSTPFEVHSAVPLGTGLPGAGAAAEDKSEGPAAQPQPCFGPGSTDDQQDTRVGRTLVAFSADPAAKASDLETAIQQQAAGAGIVIRTETVMNPPKSGKRGPGVSRPIVILECASTCDVELMIKAFDDAQAPKLKRLSRLVYPDVIGGACSFS